MALGTAVGVPAARQVKMTAMPQMVALFNGVGGGAVFLISWAEFRRTGGFSGIATYITVFSLFAAIVGSVSFWGSNIAFGKLQEIIPGRPITLGAGQQVVNRLLLVLALAGAIDIAAGDHSEAIFIGMLVCAALLGNAVVLPIGGADMPVVISLLNAFTGLSAAATGVALNNPAMIVAGMIVGASGSILTNLMAVAMNRSIPAIVAGGFGGGGAVEGASGAGEHAGTVRSTTAADAAIQLAYANRVVVVPGYGMAVAQAQHAVRELTKELEKRGVEVSYAIHPVAGRMPGPHERAAGRGGRPLRPAQGDGRRQPRVPAHRRLAGDRGQRRHQPGGQEQPLLADLRDADPGGRRQPLDDRDQALDEPRLRGHRKRALLRPEDDDAVRRREVRPSARSRPSWPRSELPLCDTALVIERSQALAALSQEEFDVVVVGGGITGAGVALDAASRGYSVALLERDDFASGTSSRSSKLVHGGLRYLQNFDLGLVREALLERRLMVQLAPHLVRPLPLVVPAFDGARPDRLVGVGLNLYDVMSRRARRAPLAPLAPRPCRARQRRAGRAGAEEAAESWSPERHRVISGEEVLELLPALAAARADQRLPVLRLPDRRRAPGPDGARRGRALRGRVRQPRRRARACSSTRAARAAWRCATRESGSRFQVRAANVVNATGVWADQLRPQELHEEAELPSIRPSRGTHILLRSAELPLRGGAIVPAGGGRSIFALPWLGHALVGTTDNDYEGPLDHVEPSIVRHRVPAGGRQRLLRHRLRARPSCRARSPACAR